MTYSYKFNILGYEDEISIPSKPIVCGFSLDTLSAQSCDENWIPKFVHREKGQKMAFKLVELENMAFYINNNDEMLTNVENEELVEKMSLKNKGNVDKFNYVLNPISATATIKRNCSEKPLNSRKTPRIACNLETGDVHFNVTDDQFKAVVTSARTLHQLHKNKNYWKWRPRENVKENPGAWWHYVIACEMERIHERNYARSWESTLQKARENVKYVEAFKKYLENPVVFDADLKEHKDKMDLTRSYEELKVLREQAVILLESELGHEKVHTEELDTESNVDDDTSEAAAQSTLQRWFPLWGGWYGTSYEQEDAVEIDHESSRLEESRLEEELIEAITDDVATAVPYKDVVFLVCSFSMTRATTKLFSKSTKSPDGKPLFEFEFSDAKLEVETRPRTQSNRLELSLGAMCVRDFVTQDTMFPVLISPINVQGAPLFPKKSGAGGLTGLSGLAKTFQNYLYAPTSSANQGPLFYMLYEKKPSSKVDVRLHVKSQPLNIVYNPAVVHCIGSFFKIPEDLNKNARLSEKIRQAAFTRIEEVKELTKAEFKRNIDNLLEESSDNSFYSRKSWDIDFDMCAPQIIIPEHFFDKDATIMVVDLGKFHLQSETCSAIRKQMDEMQQKQKASTSSSYYSYLPGFSNTSQTSVQKSPSFDDDDEDDEFVTPASSPTSPAAPVTIEDQPVQSPELSNNKEQNSSIKSDLEAVLNRKMFEKFSISMSDMQIILGRVKDNWRHAHVKGNSSLHLLDKFSIALHCERRIMATNDPNLPNIAISGTLPKLSAHINEDKVYLLDRINRLLMDQPTSKTDNANRKSVPTQTCEETIEEEDGTKSSAKKTDDVPQRHIKEDDSLVEIESTPKLFLVYFCIAEMSVELQSLGKSIVELQVLLHAFNFLAIDILNLKLNVSYLR